MNESRLGDPDLLILCYHAVSDSWPDVGAVTSRALRAQLGTVLGRGYRPRTLSAALAEPRGTRSVAITFDDAFASVVERGFPVLRELGAPATVFVPTDFAAEAGRMTWSALERWREGRHDSELRCMSWAELRSLAEAGWEIGSHSRSHPDLTAIGTAEVERELAGSKRACEEALQRPCPTFAYPFGAHDDRVVGLAARAGYEAAVTLGERLVGPLSAPGPLQIPREGIYRTSPHWLFSLATGPAVRRLRATRPYAWVVPLSRA